jgi:glycosyltransferase involved in cell wall biosynthesis
MRALEIWMNAPSPYQADVFREIATAAPSIRLHVTFAGRIPPERRALGWDECAKGFAHDFLPSRWAPAAVFDRLGHTREAFHLVNGIWAEPSFLLALISLCLRRHPVFLYSEAPSPLGRTGLGRQLRLGVREALRGALRPLLRSRVSGAFAAGAAAAAHLQAAGVRPPTILPFGYFRNPPTGGPKADDLPVGAELLYVGQLIPRKGLDLLFRAVAAVAGDHPDLSVTLVGEGPAKPALEALAAELGIKDRVSWVGSLPPSAIHDRMTRAAAVVLPTRWDGWGLVVNEALQSGVPVIVSSAAGAAELVAHGCNGFVHEAGDLTALTEAIGTFASSRGAWPSYRAAAAEAGEYLSARDAAHYLIDGMRWLSGGTERPPEVFWRAWKR